MDITTFDMSRILSFREVQFLFKEMEGFVIEKEPDSERIEITLNSRTASEPIIIITYNPTLNSILMDLKNIGWKEYSLSL